MHRENVDDVLDVRIDGFLIETIKDSDAAGPHNSRRPNCYFFTWNIQGIWCVCASELQTSELMLFLLQLLRNRMRLRIRAPDVRINAFLIESIKESDAAGPQRSNCPNLWFFN